MIPSDITVLKAHHSYHKHRVTGSTATMLRCVLRLKQHQSVSPRDWGGSWSEILPGMSLAEVPVGRDTFTHNASRYETSIRTGRSCIFV